MLLQENNQQQGTVTSVTKKVIFMNIVKCNIVKQPQNKLVPLITSAIAATYEHSSPHNL